MITLFHFLRLAVQNLRRGGQRVLIALLCITFGIMSLVAMSMLAKSIESAVQLTPAELLGGDISMGRKKEATLRPQDIEQLKDLQQRGAIRSYTLIAFGSSVMFHAPGSAEMHFVGSGLGIETEKYPLAGALTLEEPGSTGLPTLLQQPGDVVVTRDVAEEFRLQVGQRILLVDPRVGSPLDGTVRGVAYDTPNHQGDKIYYSLETAQKMAGGQPVINTVIVNTDQPQALSETLDSSGWEVDWAAGRRGEQTANMWMIGLRGAGILGLLVGGIGIANTMQVLLRRRQHEIAIWKTLGYRAGDLRLIFTLEAGLLGLTGSLLGAGLGVLISSGLLVVFRSTSSLLYRWTFSPIPPLMGILVGTLSTVVFAAWAIVASSQARPMSLLRGSPLNEQVEAGTAARGSLGCQSAALGLLLAGLFTALASLVMGSLLSALGVLVGIAFGLALLGGFFSLLLWVCTRLIPRLLPAGGFPLARMALTGLRRRGLALVFAMIALFTGVFSMSLGQMVAQKSQSQMAPQGADFQSYNLNILVPAGKADRARQAIAAQKPEQVSVGSRAALAGLSAAGEPLAATEALLVGRDDPADYVIHGAAWGSQPDGVYVNRWANLKPGAQVIATLRDGTRRTFTVVGSYDLNQRTENLYPPAGLLMTSEALARVTRPDTLLFFARVAPNRLAQAEAALGAALPRATVVDLLAYAGRFMQSYQNLYLLPMILAGLALLAGLLLVANSVSLAMLDRRGEIGVLKTIGYSRGQILSIFAVEYGLAGVLATAAGVLVVQVMLAGLALATHLPASALLLSLPAFALVGLAGVGLTLLTVVGVTWQPTRVSPVIVLNEGN